MLDREIVITGDGSSTIHLPEWDEQYHSKHGAIQEAYHVFIKHGLHHFCHSEHNEERLNKAGHTELAEISILEIGFGTGLNAFITLLEAEKLNTHIDYFGIEGYPVQMDEINQLNYPERLKFEAKADVFKALHEISWEKKHKITNHFSLTKQNKFFNEIEDKEKFNIV